MGAERFMREHAPNEVATLIAENNTDTQKTVKSMHKLLQGRRVLPIDNTILDMLLSLQPSYVPITQIVDSVHFADKDDAFLNADRGRVRAYPSLCRRREPNCEEFFKEILGDQITGMAGQDSGEVGAGMRILHW